MPSVTGFRRQLFDARTYAEPLHSTSAVVFAIKPLSNSCFRSSGFARFLPVVAVSQLLFSCPVSLLRVVCCGSSASSVPAVVTPELLESQGRSCFRRASPSQRSFRVSTSLSLVRPFFLTSRGEAELRFPRAQNGAGFSFRLCSGASTQLCRLSSAASPRLSAGVRTIKSFRFSRRAQKKPTFRRAGPTQKRLLRCVVFEARRFLTV